MRVFDDDVRYMHNYKISLFFDRIIMHSIYIDNHIIYVTYCVWTGTCILICCTAKIGRALQKRAFGVRSARDECLFPCSPEIN